MATYRRLPSGQWQARVWHPGLKRQVPLGFTHPLKKVMREAAADAEQRLRAGEWVDPKLGQITLTEWWAKWSAMRVVEKSTTLKDVSRWRNHVEPAFGAWQLTTITSEDVEEWVAQMRRDKVGGETLAGSLRLLKQLLDKAVLHKRLLRNAAAGITAPTPPRHDDRFLTVRESKVLTFMLTGVDRLMVEMFLGTGLRWAELAGLHVYRIDTRRRVVKVREVMERDGSVKLYPKTAAGWRTVPLTDRLARKLERHIAGNPPRALVFTAPGGGPLIYSNWRKRVWMRALTKARLADPQPTPHDLRHTYGSWLAEWNLSPTDIQALMGHESLRSTERYLHASPARMDRARALLSRRHGVGTAKLVPVQGGRESAKRRRKKNPPRSA